MVGNGFGRRGWWRAAAGLVVGWMAEGILCGLRGSGWFFRTRWVGSGGMPSAPLVM
jgi:hypothetical protein